MEAEEYSAQQQAISAALIAVILRLLEPFRTPALSERDWLTVLEILYPKVLEHRRESARLGRRFYDSQRQKHVKTSEKHNMFLAEYEFDWFREAMRPAKKQFIKPGAGDSGASQVALRAVKEVENGARRTILRAVESDPVEPWWARVATGRETCGFCLMLVSRGPVYRSAETAGMDADDTTAQELWEQGDEEALDELMTRWHPGCDCKVVPVFDRKNWPGRDAYLRAEKLWVEATRGYKGKDALNALRRAINEGDIEFEDFSIAA